MGEKTFVVDVTWMMSKQVGIKAKSLEEAKQLAEKLDLRNGIYVEDSFQVENIEELDSKIAFDNEIRAAIRKYGDHNIDIIIDEERVYGTYHSSNNSFCVTDTYNLEELGGIDVLKSYEEHFANLCVCEN